MYLEGFSLFLPTVMLIKDHLVNQEKGEVEYHFWGLTKSPSSICKHYRLVAEK